MVRKRPGMAVIMVLGLLAITLAFSYAMIRSSSTSASIQRNSGRRGDARQAAMSGVSAALRKIHQDDWAGVGTSLSGTLSATESYQVTYSLGDPSLSPSNPDWEDYAYRVTIDSIGYASAPTQPTLVSKHKIRVVVHLAPELMSAEPTDWATFQQYTVFQARDREFRLELPARIEGPVRIQGEVKLATQYPSNTVVDGANRLLFVVENPSGLTSQESLRQAKFVEWGYSVDLIDDNDPQSAYDAALADNDVAYVSEEALSTNVSTKLKDFVIGVVSDESYLTQELGLSSDSNTVYGVSNLNIIDTSHDITSDFNVGLTAILDVGDSGGILTGALSPGLRVLGQWGAQKALAVLSAGGPIYNGGFATGRRVQLPWSGSSFDFSSVNDNGHTIMERAVEWASRGNPRRRYLRDLEVMRLSGSSDYRPFDGPLKLPLSNQDTATMDDLTDLLGVTAEDLPAVSVAADWQKPTNLTSYRIYKGGPLYTVATVSGTLQNTTLEPDPLTNPLGLFYRATTVHIEDNVTIRGTLFCGDDIKVRGESVQFLPVELPPLYGASVPIRLPVACCRDFYVEDLASGSLTGLLCVFDRFEIINGAASTKFSITGRVVVEEELRILERNEWNNADFSVLYRSFTDQASHVRFPAWLATQSYDPQPQLTIKPDPGQVIYHWQDPTAGTAVFVPQANPDGIGLHWDVIDWRDNP